VPNGSVYDNMDFLPFGEQIAGGGATNFKFTGKERDWESNLDNFGARYYSSQLGRFMSADWSAIPEPVPYANLTNPQTLNLYAMVRDNPETFADLDGHDASGGCPSSADCREYAQTSSTEQQQQQETQQQNQAARLKPPPDLTQDIVKTRKRRSCDAACQLRRKAAWTKLEADALMFAVMSFGDDELLPEAEEMEAAAQELAAEAEAAEAEEAAGAAEATRNPAQDKVLSKGDIKKLQKNGIDPHDLKPNSKYDLFKDRKGNVYVKPKDGSGAGDETGINLNDL